MHLVQVNSIMLTGIHSASVQSGWILPTATTTTVHPNLGLFNGSYYHLPTSLTFGNLGDFRYIK